MRVGGRSGDIELLKSVKKQLQVCNPQQPPPSTRSGTIFNFNQTLSVAVRTKTEKSIAIHAAFGWTFPSVLTIKFFVGAEPPVSSQST